MRRALVAVALALGGCGEAVDFEGEADVPDGYATYSGQGVSFAHPELSRTEDDKKLLFGDPTAFVELRVREGEARTPRDFDVYLRSFTTIGETLGKAKLDITEQDVPGADDARLIKVKSPPKRGANAKELTSRILIVDRGDDVIQLSAGTQAGSEKKVDADAVISSFRLR